MLGRVLWFFSASKKIVDFNVSYFSMYKILKWCYIFEQNFAFEKLKYCYVSVKTVKLYPVGCKNYFAMLHVVTENR